jgi:hypothetical protein
MSWLVDAIVTFSPKSSAILEIASAATDEGSLLANTSSSALSAHASRSSSYST